MIAIGSDHGGYKLKEEIKNHFKDLEFKDFGAYSEERTNYPDIAISLAESVANGECTEGILICRSGIGMSIAANKVKGIRCALCYSVDTAKSAKEHNNANIIAIGGDIIPIDEAIEMVNIWRNSQFLNGRYQERIKMVEDYENKK